MKILITGGAGFIGSHLVERLVKEGHILLVIDDLSNGQLKNLEAVKERISFLKHDVSNPIHLDFQPQTIFHLSCFPRSRSFIQPQRDVEVNVIEW